MNQSNLGSRGNWRLNRKLRLHDARRSSRPKPRRLERRNLVGTGQEWGMSHTHTRNSEQSVSTLLWENYEGITVNVISVFVPDQPCRKDNRGRVSGGKDLASTARYPDQFCSRIFALWFVEFDKLTHTSSWPWVLEQKERFGSCSQACQRFTLQVSLCKQPCVGFYVFWCRWNTCGL